MAELKATPQEFMRCPDCGQSISGDYRFVLHRAFKHGIWDLLDKWYEDRGRINPFARKQESPKLQGELEKLRRELWRHKRKPTGIVGYGFMLLGAIALVSSIFYMSNLVIFVGVALVLWGAILLFVRPERYVKNSLLDSTGISSCIAINKMISQLRFEGEAMYLPPKSLKDLRSGKVFIGRRNITVPRFEASTKEKIFFNPEGICIIPPGVGLANLYEDELGTSFTRVNLDYIQDNLPRLFSEGLQIADKFSISIEGDKVKVRMQGSVYSNFCRKAIELARSDVDLCGRIGCPLCSSIACVLARTTGKTVIIQENNVRADENMVEVQYRIVGR